MSRVLRWLWPHKPLNSFSIGWYHSWILFTLLFILSFSSHLKQHFVPSAEENVLFNSPSFCHGHPLLTQLTGARRGVPQGVVWTWLPWSWKCYDKSFSFHSSPLLKVKRCSTLPFNHYNWPFPPFPAISSDSWLWLAVTHQRGFYQQMLACYFRSTYVKIIFRNDTMEMLEITS